MERLQTFGYVRAIDEDQLRVQVVVSTGAVARDGMVIDQSGWDFANYDRNPVVLWGHDDHEMPVARAIPESRVSTSNELIETHEFDGDDPRARELFRKVQRGFVNATSVRWSPISWEFRQIDGREVLAFTKQELLESSYVSIPADPGAMVIRASGHPIDPNEFRPQPSPEEVAAKRLAADMERLADALERANFALKEGANV